MANENAINLIVTAEALAQIQAAIDKVDALDKLILKTAADAAAIGGKLGGIKTPSGVAGNGADNAKINADLKEQAAQLKQLETLKAKVAAATSEENKEIIAQRIALAEQNKQIKQGIQEQTSAYAKLNNARTAAQKTLKDLIASEKASNEEIAKAQKQFDELDKKVKKADHSAQDFTKSVGDYKNAFDASLSKLSSFGGGFNMVATKVIGFKQTGKDLINTVGEINDKVVTSAKAIIGFGNASKAAAVAANEMAVAQTAQAVATEGVTVATETATVATGALDVALGILLAPVTLIIAAFSLLIFIFKDFAPLVNPIKDAFAGLSAIFMTAKQAVMDLVTGARSLKDVFTNLGGEMKAAAIEAANVNKELRDLAKQSDINEVAVAKAATQVQKLILQSKDRTKTEAERIALAEKAIEIEKKASAESLKINQDKIDVQKKLILEGRHLSEEQLKDLEKNDFAAIRSLKGKKALNGEEIDELKRLLLERESLKQHEIQVEEKAQNRINLLADNAEKKQQEVAEKKRKLAEDEEKRLADIAKTEFELTKQRFEFVIESDNEIAKNKELNDAKRIEAVNERAIIEEALLKETRDFQLKNANNTAADIKRINEKFDHDKIALEKKTAADIKEINEFDPAIFEAEQQRELNAIQIANNEAILEEEKRFAAEEALGFKNDKAKEKAAEKHEKNLFEIKKAGLIQTTQLQKRILEAELAAYIDFANADGKITQAESDMIGKIRKDLSDATVALYQAENEKFKEGEDDKANKSKITASEILQFSEKMLGGLADLANAFTERRISNLENELEASNKFYENQINQESTGEKKKQELEKERAKREEEINKRIGKEKEKQAKIDKAVSIAQIGIQTALAIIKAAPNPFLIAFAAATGAISLATAIATPIPKYKDGGKIKKDQFAIVGDGGRVEVVTDEHGNDPYFTPKTATLTHLKRGDIVHKSIDDFNAFKMAQMKEVALFGSTKDNNDLLNEMQLTRKVIEKQKLNVNVAAPKIDINHALWRNNIINWS